jgi:hypothetical protein
VIAGRPETVGSFLGLSRDKGGRPDIIVGEFVEIPEYYFRSRSKENDDPCDQVALRCQHVPPIRIRCFFLVQNWHDFIILIHDSVKLFIIAFRL